MTVTMERPTVAVVQHGAAGYKRGCRCRDCTTALVAYNRHVRREKLYGRWKPYVDAGPAREHIAELRRAGIGMRQIAKLAGVSVEWVRDVAAGRNGRIPTRQVRPEAAAAVLAVRAAPENLSENLPVDSTGSVRRVRALVALGWSFAQQAEMIGWDRRTLRTMTGNKGITPANAKLIAALYDRLSMTPAPVGPVAERMRRLAGEKGWAPPLAWDDDRIDDPQARPFGWTGAPETYTLAEFAALYLPLVEKGLRNADIGDRLNITANAVASRAKRARAAGLLPQTGPGGWRRSE